ncbi:hypothetical protein HMPREF9565_00654 [Cutibacterium acnes HL053PA2]|nr:hypothetical protein HMPREF9565_00654 [Cutibacterium acnes HL053PA2]
MIMSTLFLESWATGGPASADRRVLDTALESATTLCTRVHYDSRPAPDK